MEDSGRLDIHLQLPDFAGFPKIPRLRRDAIITEKIDGTNAQLLITDDGRIFAGSRKRWLTPEKDNYGFAAWVWEHYDELLKLGPGRHFGEWWGQGIQRNYGLDQKRFSLFNVGRWCDPVNERIGAPLPSGDCHRIAVPACCHVVPILAVGNFTTWLIGGALQQLHTDGSAAAPGFMKPEGIVIYHTAGNCLFKVTLENDEKPKENTDD